MFVLTKNLQNKISLINLRKNNAHKNNPNLKNINLKVYYNNFLL